MSTTFTRYDFSLGTSAVDLAIADVDGDGKLDFVITNVGDAAKLLVLQGDGAGSFSIVTNIDVTTGYPSLGFVAVADMDSDGDLDVVYDSYYDYSVRVLLNDGAGGYTAGTPATFNSRPMSMTLGDVNGDGKTDAVTTSQNGTITVLLNDGQGGFLTPITNTTIASRYPGNVTLADMNGDGKLDIVATSNSSNTVSVLLGDGAGGFTSVTSYSMGSRLPGAVTVGDVNKDGKLDVLTSNLDGTVSVLLGNGSGGFTSVADVSVGSNPQTVALADLNGDGNLDLVAAVSNTNSVAIRWGDGEGNFATGMSVAVGYSPRTVKAADVNDDGRMDIVVTDLSSNAVTVLLGGEKTDVTAISSSGSGTLKIGDTITFTLETEHSVTVADFPELILSNGRHAVYAGLDSNGRPTFTYTVSEGDTETSGLSITGIDTTNGTVDGRDAALSFAGPAGVAGGIFASDLVLADVNGDGKLDLLLSAGDAAGIVSVRLGDGAGGFSGAVEFGVGGYPTDIATADINGDGKLDLLTAGLGDTGVIVRLGDGAGGFSGSYLISSMYHYPIAVSTADMNGDGKLDLLTSDTLGQMSVRLGNGSGNFSDGSTLTFSSNPYDFKTADVNGDGKLDLLVAIDNAVSVRLGDGTGNFSGSTDVSVGTMPYSIDVADVNGDGKLDIVTANIANNSVSVRLGDGTGNFSGGEDVSVGAGPFIAVVADMNGDGKLDIVTGNATDRSVSIRLGDGEGHFSVGADIPVQAYIDFLSVGDVNGDGRPDIVFASGMTGGVWTLLNTSVKDAPFDEDSVSTADGAQTGRRVDATRPDTVTVALQFDTGTSDDDRLTSNGALDIAGTEDGATLTYVVDGETLTSYNPDELADGSHTISVTQTDEAGNVSDVTELTFTLDRTAANAPAIALESDTGTSNGDLVTSNGALDITGTEDGATLIYVIDGETLTSYNPDELADGSHTISATQTDKAGNVSEATEFTFTLDRAAAPPVLSLISDTGSSSADRVSSNAALSIVSESGATLSYSIDGGDASAAYDATALTDGEHTVEVIQTDKAGNVSSAGSITFVLDKTAPTVTGVTASGPGVSGGSGTLTTGRTATFSVALSEAVTVAGAADMVLTLGNGAQAIFDADASTAQELVFRYTVGLEETASDLSVTGVVLQGASIKDAAGNTADLAAAATNPPGTLVIDGYTGTSGADSFRGTSGANTFRGLGSNDSYVVNHAGDVVVEAAKGGTDLVKASVSFTLAVNVENLTLTGTAAINASGNTLANVLNGNTATNTLWGGKGADTLTGGKGADTFLFRDVAESTVNARGRDHIMDFSRNQHDRIDLHFIDANEDKARNQAFDFIGTDKFDGHAGQLRYEQQSGHLLVQADTDGDRKADFAILVDGAARLEQADFVL